MAKKAVGSLRYDLEVNSKPFSTGLNRASKKAKSFSETIKGIGFKKFALAAAGAATALAGAISLVTKRQLAMVDALAKTSSRLDITVKQYQTLQHSAKKAGVNAGILEKSLGTMAKRLGEAQRGAGAAANAIEQLGLNADSLFQMNAAQQIETIAGAWNNLANANEEADVAAALFNKSGMKLINMLRAGGDAIDDSREKLERLGAAISQDMAGEIQRANDLMADNALIMDGFERKITMAVVPALNAFAAAMLDISLSSDLDDAAEAFDALGEVALVVLGSIGDAAQGVSIAIDYLQGSLLAAQKWNAYANLEFEEAEKIQKRQEKLAQKIRKNSELAFSTRMKQNLELLKMERGRNRAIREREKREREASKAAVKGIEAQIEAQQRLNSASGMRSLPSPMPGKLEGVTGASAALKRQMQEEGKVLAAYRSSLDDRLAETRAYWKNRIAITEEATKILAKRGEVSSEKARLIVARVRAEAEQEVARAIEAADGQYKSLFRTQEDELRETYANQLRIVQAGNAKLLEANVISEKEAARRVQEIRQRKNDALASLERQTWVGRLDMAAQYTTMLANALDVHDKKSFERQKKVRMVEAAIHTASAAVKAFDNAGGWPWGLIPAALTVAAGAAQIRKISRQEYGGAPTAASGFGAGGGGGGSVQTDTASSGALLADTNRDRDGGERRDRQSLRLVGNPEDRVTLEEIQEIFAEAREKNIEITGVTLEDG